ncbi:hypothetical protein J0H58_39350, partial [bacterium]|nr:hypothetical protein [bacterium]
NADSTCHRWPNTRRARDPSGFGTNRRAICRRYFPPGSPACPRVLIGMTDAPSRFQAMGGCSWASFLSAPRSSTVQQMSLPRRWLSARASCRTASTS